MSMVIIQSSHELTSVYREPWNLRVLTGSKLVFPESDKQGLFVSVIKFIIFNTCKCLRIMV